jgi:hypothetical protein
MITPDPTNRQDVFHGQIVIRGFIPEMLRVDHGALMKKSIEISFSSIFG